VENIRLRNKIGGEIMKKVILAAVIGISPA